MRRHPVTGLVVAITGGAGGLGSCLARKLLDSGAKVALLDHHPASAEAAARALGDTARVRGWGADVKDAEGLVRTFDDVAEHFGRIDVVVANAAVMGFSSVADQDPGAFAETIDVNLTGVWRTFRAAIPHLERRRGYLLAVSSMSAFSHQPLHGPYCASKAGVWALSNVARLELKPRGIDVGTLFPTFFDSPMTENAYAHPAAAKVWGRRQKALGMLPTTSVDTAAERALDAISRRSRQLTVRRDHWLVSRSPGLVQPIIDRFGWSDAAISEAVRLVDGEATR